MNETAFQFIQERQIDSFQKLSFLLFLHRYAPRNAITPAFARQLHFNIDPTFEEIVEELTAAGLLHHQDETYALKNEPEIRQGLAQLVELYEDPLARQQLLGRLYRHKRVTM